MTTRFEYAQNVLQSLQSVLPKAQIDLRGSVFTGTDDKYSDIDILVDDPTQSNSLVLSLVIDKICHDFPVEFYDTAKAFLPKECVTGFFMKDLPLYCCVEVSVIAPEEQRILTREDISTQLPDHYLKLWIISARKLARKPSECPMDLKFLVKMLELPNVEDRQPVDLLRKVFSAISLDVQHTFPGVHALCLEHLKENAINVEQTKNRIKP